MRTDRTDFQMDLEAWFEDEKSKITVETWELIKKIPDYIAEGLPGFVQFMTVEELCQVLDDI